MRAVVTPVKSIASVPVGSTALPRAASCSESVPALKAGRPLSGLPSILRSIVSGTLATWPLISKGVRASVAASGRRRSKVRSESGDVASSSAGGTPFGVAWIARVSGRSSSPRSATLSSPSARPPTWSECPASSTSTRGCAAFPSIVAASWSFPRGSSDDRLSRHGGDRPGDGRHVDLARRQRQLEGALVSRRALATRGRPGGGKVELRVDGVSERTRRGAALEAGWAKIADRDRGRRPPAAASAGDISGRGSRARSRCDTIEVKLPAAGTLLQIGAHPLTARAQVEAGDRGALAPKRDPGRPRQ